MFTKNDLSVIMDTKLWDIKNVTVYLPINVSKQFSCFSLEPLILS